MSMKICTALLVIALLFPVGLTCADDAGKSLIVVGDFTHTISTLHFDPARGKVELLHKQKGASRPSYMIADSGGKMLYVTSEYSNAKKFWTSGTVAAYKLDKGSGKLTLINSQQSGGVPCYLSMPSSGKFVLCASFDGSVQVFPVNKDGSLDKASTNIKYPKPAGGDKKARGHAHSVVLSPDEKYVFVQGQGSDRIWQYEFDAETGKLTPNEISFIEFPVRTGPRHLTFHPSGKYAYVVNEKHNTVISFDYDTAKGTLNKSGETALAPLNDRPGGGGADIHISADGKFLYASNRNHHTILIAKINPADGTLEHVEFFKTGGEKPRSFVLLNDDKHMLVVHRNADDLYTFERNADTGKLTEVAKFSITNGAAAKNSGAVFIGKVK